MDERDPHMAELLGAALAGELTPDEARELEDACQHDPELRAELAELSTAAEQLRGSGVHWTDADPPPDLRARLLDVAGQHVPGPDGTGTDPAGRQDDVALDGVTRAGGAGTGPTAAEVEAGVGPAPRPDVVPLRARRRTAPLLVAAAAGVVVGVGGTLLGAPLLDAPPSGPPGTLGAVEEIDFAGEQAGSTVEGAVVAHTWGTETVLEVDGTIVGQTFQVVVVGRDGEEFSSGAFVGSTETVVCRMNAAVLREDAAEVRIEGADQQVLAAAALEPVD